MTQYNFSYSTMADIYAVAQDEDTETRTALLKFAEDLEQVGIGWYDSKEYILRGSPYGMEVVSMEDYQSEQGDDEDE